MLELKCDRDQVDGLKRLSLLTQLMRQLVAEHSHRGGQTRSPGQGEGRAHGQAVRKVVDAVADGDHEGQQALL